MRLGRKRKSRFVKIAEPQVGDDLNVRTDAHTATKGLVCRKRAIIACLAPGDRLRFKWNYKQHAIWKKQFGLSKPDIQAEFCYQEGFPVRDSFKLENGKIISMQELSGRVQITVLSVAPRDHMHDEELPAYSDDAIGNLLDGVSLPAPTPMDSRSHCGTRELVGV